MGKTAINRLGQERVEHFAFLGSGRVVSSSYKLMVCSVFLCKVSIGYLHESENSHYFMKHVILVDELVSHQAVNSTHITPHKGEGQKLSERIRCIINSIFIAEEPLPAHPGVRIFTTE